MLSVNTNYGALLALQSLNATQKDLATVQSRITTGLKVGDAKDNGAVFAIAEGQRARLTSLTAIKEAMDRAGSAMDVALASWSNLLFRRRLPSVEGSKLLAEL